jgi:tRNA threonylcarbamoyladenosine biosynthesis protein TsaB
MHCCLNHLFNENIGEEEKRGSMKILAVETSTMLGGIAICDDAAGLIAEVRLNVKSTHSERLMTEIDHVLRRSSLTVSDMDVFAVAIGPGSFTGLRIGLGTVKGFSYATGNPIVSVPTLEAFAWNFPFSMYPVCTMLDARKKEVYAAVFRWDQEGFARLIDETSIRVEKLLRNLRGTGDNMEGGFPCEKIIFIGEGAVLYKDKIVEEMGDSAVFPPAEKMIPSPENVASLGMKKALRGEFSEPVGLVPFYIRRSEAEIKQSG